MPERKSQTDFNPTFDPNRTPHNSPAANFQYWKHPTAGKLMVDSSTKVVTPIPGKMYVQMPLKVPKEMMDVDQPHIRTCGTPTGTHKGCNAAEGGGCPILRQYGRVGPVNVIIERHSNVNSVPCYHAYCGMTEMGRPTSQAHSLLDGWRILTDRTTIPENVIDPGTNRLAVRETEVPDLAPFYEEAGAGRFNGNGSAPKKRGRPKKVLVAD